LQDVALAHATPPAHGAVLPPVHVPDPLHEPPMVRLPPEHDTAPHEVPAWACSHTPPAAQLPSLPQGGLATHCPAGATEPAMRFAHVPFATPVSAIVHAWQVPVHGELQQIWLPGGPTQLPFRHCEPAVQGWPFGRSAHVVP
jgi:hypothetical protein